MKKKKVLIDLYSLENPNCGFGQIAVNYAKLFSEIQRSGKEDFDIAFMLPYTFRKKISSMPELKGVECYFEGTWWHHKFKFIPYKQPKVDVWHSVNQFCRRYPDDPTTKMIFTIHDYNFLFEETEERQHDLLNVMQERIDKSSALTFISHYTEDIVKKHSNVDGKYLQTIYNGVQPLTKLPQQKPVFVNNDKPFFFAIGQFLPKKKFDILLDVMKFFPDKELYICGQNDFPFGKEIIKRISDERITNVHTPGSISNNERVWLFANCEAYLFPSIGEGFGLPAIEAMQFGKPVFASNYQSLPEIVKNHGYVWPSLEPTAMAQVIKESLSDFNSHPEKSKQIADYAASFSYEKHIEAYLKLYRELLEV